MYVQPLPQCRECQQNESFHYFKIIMTPQAKSRAGECSVEITQPVDLLERGGGKYRNLSVIPVIVVYGLVRVCLL